VTAPGPDRAVKEIEMPPCDLDASLVKDILVHLGVPAAPQMLAPTLRNLDRLIEAYTRRVPWESVSRIIKRNTTSPTTACPRWPEEFWADAVCDGLGGTCFESSLAFLSLLTCLGYEGYLTLNDMGESRACHAAIVVILEGRKYLVDITISMNLAVGFRPEAATWRRTPFHDYTICPQGDGRYQVERTNHPQKNAFTLIDRPVGLSEYRAVLEGDYAEDGLFLKSVVMIKVIDGRIWRFFSDRLPYRLESFNRDGREEIILAHEALVETLAGKFQLPEEKIAAAFLSIQMPVTARCGVRAWYVAHGFRPAVVSVRRTAAAVAV